MRWVDRGPEPAGVAGYARQFTQGWIDHYVQRLGQIPTDSFWREFRINLGNITNEICWYCERQCHDETEVGSLAPTVDHFRPRSRFPELVYSWSNWIFSCRRCNQEKGNKWPSGGFVDPCAAEIEDWPENNFDYDLLTGDLIPRTGLPDNTRRKIWDTIDDLGLNKFDVKIHRMEVVQHFLNGVLGRPNDERNYYVEERISGPSEHAGSIGMIAAQLQLRGEV